MFNKALNAARNDGTLAQAFHQMVHVRHLAEWHWWLISGGESRGRAWREKAPGTIARMPKNLDCE
jgi:hypothetical protein